MKDLLELVQSETGCSLVKKAAHDGGEFAGPCPFCGGKDRFRVWPNSASPTYWCRQCHRKGDQITLVRQLHKLNYVEACKVVGKEMTEMKKREREIIKKTTWEIKDHSGKYVATHIRIDFADGGKDYPWEVNGKRGLNGLSSKTMPLYGSENISEFFDGSDIIICEGEKAASALMAAGFNALGTVCGAQSIPDISVFRPLVGKKCNIMLWPDNDAPGKKHMEGVATVLKSLGVDPYTIYWETAQDKQDAADYVSQGLPAQKLLDGAKIHRTAPYYPLSMTVVASYDSAMELCEGVKPDGLVMTGYHAIDHAIDGLRPWFTVLCGRPGMCKTTLALQSLAKSSTPEAKGVFISLETPAAVVVERLAKYNCGINARDIYRGMVSGTLDEDKRRDWISRLSDAYAVVHDLPMLVRDRQRMTPDELRTDIEMLMTRETISAIVIDHMGKMKGEGKGAYERASFISKELSSIAMEYNIPIVAICQLNRESESEDRKDRRPRLSDLRSSGEIEEDARVVLGMYRDDYYMDREAPIPGLLQVMVLKNSEGESRISIPLEYNLRTQKISDWPMAKAHLFDEYMKEKAWMPKRGKSGY